jgi:hypothetical protein
MPDKECYKCKKSLPETDFPHAIHPVEFLPPVYAAGRDPIRESKKAGDLRVWICKDCWDGLPPLPTLVI